MSHSSKLIKPKEGAMRTFDLQPIGQKPKWQPGLVVGVWTGRGDRLVRLSPKPVGCDTVSGSSPHIWRLVPGPSRLPNSEDTQIPAIKWHSIAGLSYLQMQSPQTGRTNCSVRIGLNCGTPWWSQRTTWTCGTTPLPSTNTHICVGNSFQNFKLYKSQEGEITSSSSMEIFWMEDWTLLMGWLPTELVFNPHIQEPSYLLFSLLLHTWQPASSWGTCCCPSSGRVDRTCLSSLKLEQGRVG